MSRQYLDSVYHTLCNSLQFSLERVMGCLPVTHQSLLDSMLFGHRDQLLKFFSHDFKVIGMQHVLVASGSNVTLVVGVALWVLGPFCYHRSGRSLVSLLALMIYVSLVGADPPIIRAGIMTGLSILAQLFHRQYRSWFSLGLTVILLVIAMPAWLTSVSFQLSVAATLGIILVLPRLQHRESWLSKIETADITSGNQGEFKALNSLRTVLSESLLITLAAQSLTLPLVLYYFGELATISILANTCLLWLVSVITVIGFCYVLLGGFLFLLLGKFSLLILGPVITFLWLLIECFIMGVRFFGQFDQSLLLVSFPWWMLVGWWGTIFIWWRVTLVRKSTYENMA